MAKQAVTFRLDAELVKRLKDAAARSGGKLSQAEIVESALADRFAVKDGTKLLAKVNQDQSTALTLAKEQTAALTKFQTEVGQVIVGYKQQVKSATDALDQTVRSEMRSTVASVSTMQSQLSNLIGTMRQIEDSVQRTAENRLSVLHWIGLFGVFCLSVFGLVAAVAFIWQKFGS